MRRKPNKLFSFKSSTKFISKIIDYFDSRMFRPIDWFVNWNSLKLGWVIPDKSVTLLGGSAKPDIDIGIGFIAIDSDGSWSIIGAVGWVSSTWIHDVYGEENRGIVPINIGYFLSIFVCLLNKIRWRSIVRNIRRILSKT